MDLRNQTEIEDNHLDTLVRMYFKLAVCSVGSVVAGTATTLAGTAAAVLTYEQIATRYYNPILIAATAFIAGLAIEGAGIAVDLIKASASQYNIIKAYNYIHWMSRGFSISNTP